MTKDELREEVKPRAAKIFRVEPSAIVDDLRIYDDLNATSAQLFAFAATLEKAVGHTVTMSSLGACQTMGEALSLALSAGTSTAE